MPLSSYGYNKFADAFIAEHSQLDGTHAVELITSRTEDTNPDPDADFVLTYDTSATALKKVKLENLSGSGSGWIPNVLPAPDTVTNNGNRSYDLVFNSTDLTDTVSEGMRLRTTRTVSAPTQCADLESGSSQHFTVTNAVGLATGTTWTWKVKIKPESYTTGVIAAIDDGTNRVQLVQNSSGQIEIHGGATGALDIVSSYQSVELGKWQDVTASITIGTPTGEIRINDTVVPSFVTASAATTMTISGDEEIYIGRNTAGSYYDGKICQVALFNAVISYETLKTYSGQTMTGSETSCEGFWSLDGVLTDSSANANTLVAGGGAVATATDTPFGNYLGGTLDYAIITKKAFSTNTTLTVQVPEGCTIPTSGGVSAVAYSTQSVPFNFPRDSGRWTILSLLNTNSVTASNATFGSFISAGWKLNVPVGRFNLGWKGQLDNATATSVYFHPSLTALTGLTALQAAPVSPYQIRTQSPAAANASFYSSVFEPQNITAATDFVMYSLGATTSAAVRGDLAYCALVAIPDYF